MKTNRRNKGIALGAKRISWYLLLDDFAFHYPLIFDRPVFTGYVEVFSVGGYPHVASHSRVPATTGVF